jgi:glycosyltransferase involved in cell wall biosynthesis
MGERRGPQPAIAADRKLTLFVIGDSQSTHVMTRVRCFAELGHRVFLITGRRSPNGIEGVTELRPVEETGCLQGMFFRALAWGSYRIAKCPVGDAWQIIPLARMLRQYRPDIVHVHYAYNYYGWLVALLGCRPLVVTVMGGDVLFGEQGSPTRLGKWLTLELLRKADYITSKSNHLTEVLDHLGGFGAKAERIVWGVRVSQFRRVDATELRASLGVGAARRIIFSPKILQPFYRVHLIVEAMPIVVRRCPEAVLLIAEYAADPDYTAELVRRVDALGLSEHVIFCGPIGHGTMPLFYSLAELCVSVPSSDGLPQTLLESMACETPSILGRLPRYEEFVTHEESAYFVDANPDGIADGIVRLLGDPGLRAKIAETALGIVRRDGDLEVQARRVEHRYRELAATIRPQVLSVSGLFSTWQSFRRFRKGGTEADAQQYPVPSA